MKYLGFIGEFILVSLVKTKLKKVLSTYMRAPKKWKLDWLKTLNTNSMKGFTENFLRRVMGYRNIKEYFKNFSCYTYI